MKAHQIIACCGPAVHPALTIVRGEPLRVEIDSSRFPLIVQSLRYGYDVEDLRRVMPTYDRLLSQHRRYAIVVNHEPGATIASAPMRAYLGTWQKQHEAAIKRCNVGVGVVLPSIAHRAAMTALNWLFPPVSPQRACGSTLEAVDYACEQLTANGIELTSPIHELRDRLRREIGYSIG